MCGLLGQPERRLSRNLEVARRSFSRSAVGDQFKPDLLAFSQNPPVRTFDRADMNEDIFLAVIGLNETEALLDIVPLNCSDLHDATFQRLDAHETHYCARATIDVQEEARQRSA